MTLTLHPYATGFSMLIGVFIVFLIALYTSTSKLDILAMMISSSGIIISLYLGVKLEIYRRNEKREAFIKEDSDK